MTELLETLHSSGFIASEANGERSREVVTILSGETIVAGHVLGKVTASGKYVEYDDGLVTGPEVAAAISVADVDAALADTLAVVIMRDAEVVLAELTWEATQTAGEIVNGTADLAALGIIAR